MPDVDDPDARVRAARAVLEGSDVEEVASAIHLDPTLVERWVDQFTVAGARAVAGEAPTDETARDRFLSLTAHELRNPVAVLLGWMDTLAALGDQLDRETIDTAVASMRTTIERLAQLADDMQDAAAVGLGRLRLRVVRLRLHDLVDEAVRSVGSTRVDLTVEHEQEVRADPRRLRQVIVNLVDDALRRTTAPIHVTVIDSRTAGVAEIHVRVPGTPPPFDEMLAMFEPFDRAGSAPHAGLGLYVCRALAVAHGGQVGVEAGDEDMTYWVRLPVDGPPPPSDSHRPPRS